MKVPSPMLATLVTEAFDDEKWAFEPKWDGVRAAAVLSPKGTRLISRNGNDITVAYPELADLHTSVKAKDAILDGEICAFEDGVPSFQKLQSRMHVRGPSEIARLAKQIPVVYFVFDILRLDGKDLTKKPYMERRALLDKHVKQTKHLQISPMTIGDGTALFEAARTQNLEGIVAKRLDSKYEPGRSKSWLKVKTTFDADVVVAGWRHGGTVVSAVYDGDELRYTGGVGTGYSQKSLAMLQERYAKLATDEPHWSVTREFKDVHWLRPELVAVVEFRQLTTEGKLRAPAFKGLRDDKSPRECTWDELKKAAGWKT